MNIRIRLIAVYYTGKEVDQTASTDAAVYTLREMAFCLLPSSYSFPGLFSYNML